MKIAIDTNNIITKRSAIIIGAVMVLILTICGVLLYKHYYLDYYEVVYSGLVRGNRKTKIYHIPKCPNYDRINFKNVTEFQTVAEAETAKYRSAVNCPNGIIDARKNFEAK